MSTEEKVALKLKVQTIASQMMVNIQTEPQPLVISAPTEQKTDADAQQPLKKPKFLQFSDQSNSSQVLQTTQTPDMEIRQYLADSNAATVQSYWAATADLFPALAKYLLLHLHPLSKNIFC